MSGWIKFEKDLQTDPRVLRMAKTLERRFRFFAADCADIDPCNAIALPAVTLVSGALARLWCYADSHIRDDDTLDLSPAELDELIGLPGFCALLPANWLIDLGDGRVELPGFTEKNGVEAKKRALTAKRVETHRKRNTVTACNASALPDQTRPDQTRPDQTRPDQTENIPMSAAPTRARAPCETPRPDDQPYREHWLTIQAQYPRTPTRANWLLAERNALALVESGAATWPYLAEQVAAYAAFCRATARLVAPPERFFDRDGKDRWAGDWKVPKRERVERGGLTESAKRWGEDDPEVACAGR